MVWEHLWKRNVHWGTGAQGKALVSLLTYVSLAMKGTTCASGFAYEETTWRCTRNLRAIKCGSSVVPLYCPNPLCYFFSQKGRRKSRYLTPVISFSLSNSILYCSTESGYKESFELANHSMWNLLRLDHHMVWFHISFRYLPTWPCMKTSLNIEYKIAPLLHHCLPIFLK